MWAAMTQDVGFVEDGARSSLQCQSMFLLCFDAGCLQPLCRAAVGHLPSPAAINEDLVDIDGQALGGEIVARS